MAARWRLKFDHSRSHTRTVPYARSHFSASTEARCFKEIVVHGLAVLDHVLDTKGLKKDPSTLWICSSHFLCLAFGLLMLGISRQQTRHGKAWP